MALTGQLGSADSQLGNIQLGSAGGADNNFSAAGASTSSGAVVFTLVSLNFSAAGSGVSSGSVEFKAIRVATFAGGSVSSGSVVFATLYDFVTLTEVRSYMSATIRQATPTASDPQSLYVRVDGASGAEERALLDVARTVPVGVGAQVIRANLILFQAEASPGAYTLTAEPLDGTWDASSVTWNTAPSVRAQTATASVASGGSEGTEVSINVTSLIQSTIASDDASATRWYGLRLKKSTTGSHKFHSSFSNPDYRPTLEVEWSIPPVAPLDLLPNGGRSVSEVKPELVARFFDQDAEDTMSFIRVQIDNADTFDTVAGLTYDSTKVAHTEPRFDLAAPPTGAAATPTLVAGTDYWWRMMVTDNHGIDSPWSEPAQFKVTAKGTLTLTSPATATITSPTPVITHTLTGVTQASVEVEVERKIAGVWTQHWIVPRYVSAATSHTLPDAYRLEEGESYRFTVRAWDAVEREDLAGDRSFHEAQREVTLAALS